MRIQRTTPNGVTYETSLNSEPSPELLEAMDALADAARSLGRDIPEPPGPSQEERLAAIREKVQKKRHPWKGRP